MDFDNRKVYGDTSITDGLVSFGCEIIENEDQAATSLVTLEAGDEMIFLDT